MREVKFRVWDKDSNKIYSQDDFILTFDTVGEDIYLSKNDKIIPLYRYDLMQYTGIKDKNGKEIYEGDIIDIGNGEIFTVGWHKYNQEFTFLNANNNYFENTYRGDSRDTWEVIGNIYENEDLLEK